MTTSATSQNKSTINLNSALDQSANQYTLQMLDTGNEGSVAIATAAAEVIGSLENKPKAGEQATIANGGIIKVIAGAQVAVGADIMSDAYGHGITRSGAAYSIGQAITAANAGPVSASVCEVIEVLVKPLYFAA